MSGKPEQNRPKAKPRLMTKAERKEIAAINARAKARFEAAYSNLFVYRSEGGAAQGTLAGTAETTGSARRASGPVRKDAPK